MSPAYVLDRTPRPGAARPDLDESQASVVAHRAGPMLVLAGPGTGKTTTLVEAVIARVERDRVLPEQILALTFSRKAAEQLRDRITMRLGRAISSPIASTFHSFAYGLIKANQPAETYDQPLRLLSAPEQDVVLRQLLTREEEAVSWPSGFARAIGTRGFSREVQAILARARENGLEAHGLAELARSAERDDWSSAARFLEQYLTVLDSASALDYPELMYRAVLLAERAEVKERLRAQYLWVFVDEYQDTDPSQVRLLQALAGDGRNLIVVGDPDQSIYGFRGADVRGILEFPAAFRRADGSPAPVVALDTTRRFGSRLLRASRGVVARVPTSGSIPSAVIRRFRDPVAAPGPPGAIEVCHFDTDRAEYEHVADKLRRAHLDDGVDWSQMAILVRSGRRMIPGLRRSLVAAGVPVEVAADDTPLVREPAVAPLLDTIRAAINLDNTDRSDPNYTDASRAEGLFTSPIGNLDAVGVRQLARQLRAQERRAAEAADRPARPSPELVRAALIDPDTLGGLTGPVAHKAGRLAALLRSTRDLIDASATAEDVLWHVWSATSWPRRLRSAVEAGGQAARLAHRDLDAICALFDLAARSEEQRGHTSVVNFLESLTAQQIPADTLAERGVRGSAVRLLTAHRSKGLEWDMVAVVHVQADSWPDLRRRSTLLQADQIGPDGLLTVPTPAAVIAEERRLFYVSCTRARSRLLVTAVKSPDDDGEQPSRFLDELGVPIVDVRGRPSRPMSLPGLVADLRRTAGDPACSDALRKAAAVRLATLATQADHQADRQADHQADRQADLRFDLRADHGEHPESTPPARLVHFAHPDTWWGVRIRTRATAPLRDVDQPLSISASMLEGIVRCPARWFLESEAGGATASSSSQGFGLIVHTLADRLAKAEVSTLDELMANVDRVWGELVFRTPWSSERDRSQMRDALDRLLRWHRRVDARRVLATEHAIRAEVELAGETVRIRGYVDRLEIDADGSVWVVDLKTGKYPPQDKDIAEHPQLGLYQLAVENGAVDDLVSDPPARSGGAELVQLRKELTTGVKVQTQPRQAPGPDGRTVAVHQLAAAAATLRREQFPAVAGPHCEQCDFQPICPIKGAGTVLS